MRILPESRGGKWALFWASIPIAVASLYVAINTSYFRSTLPPEISVYGPALFVTGNPAGGLIGGGDGCTAAVMFLTRHSRSEIERGGLAHLKSFNIRHQSIERQFYQEWHEAPLPKAAFSEGIWPNLSCAPFGYAQAIYGAMKQPGSFALYGRHRTIYVVPDQGIVASTWFR